MKKNILLLACSLTLSLLIALGVLRYLEPRLFRQPADMQVVQLDRKVPAFYSGVFRAEDATSTDFLIPDPVVGVRGRPFLPEISGVGPHDALGFRNSTIPYRADVIAIGDSQTYGINAIAYHNWPSILKRSICGGRCQIYAMALGSWGAIQYLAMAEKALHFNPRAIVVAIYTGNDALETFRTAYSINYWKPLRIAAELTLDDLPPIEFPPPKDKYWSVQFPDGSHTVLSPEHRLASNNPEIAAVAAGYEIVATVVKKISAMAASRKTRVFFTVIPTKEYVFKEKIERSGITPPAAYLKLVEGEKHFTDRLTLAISRESNSTYIDVIHPLIDATQSTNQIYPEDSNGHPLAQGYQIIGETIAATVGSVISLPSGGLLKAMISEEETWYYKLIDSKLYRYETDDAIRKDGLRPEDAKVIEYREVAAIPLAGIVK